MISARIIVRFLSKTYSTRPKPIVNLNDTVLQDVKDEKFKPKHHPGKSPKIRDKDLPPQLISAIVKSVKDYPIKSLVKNGHLLSKFLEARKPPAERMEVITKQREIMQQLDTSHNVDPNTFDEEELANYKKRRSDQLAKILKERIQSWQAIVYDEYKALQYLMGRSAPEYAVLLRIMSEIERRDPAFKPLSFFDFGAGVGTGIWAASRLWRSSIHEYCLVDCSAHMNDLSAFILRDGDENKELSLKNVFHRQFLPSSPLKYDLVLSAYSLMELGGYQQRMDVVDNLWNKCDGYLVFVERGTMAGFKLIDEVRERLIASNAQVFSPCPHSAACPRIAANDRTPCNFEVNYNTLPIVDSVHNRKELYSYVVVRKPGDGDATWPRIVRPVLQRHKHAICRMCTAKGELQEVIFSPGKHGKIAYKVAKSSKWGDRLPIEISDETKDETTS